MTFCAFLSFTFKVGYLENPFKQIGKPNTIDLSFVEIIAKTFIEFLGNVFMIGPMYRWFKMSHRFISNFLLLIGSKLIANSSQLSFIPLKTVFDPAKLFL